MSRSISGTKVPRYHLCVNNDGAIEYPFRRGNAPRQLGCPLPDSGDGRQRVARSPQVCDTRLEEIPLLSRTMKPLESYHHVYVDDPFGNKIELVEPAAAPRANVRFRVFERSLSANLNVCRGS
jgi:hypothetical protein